MNLPVPVHAEMLASGLQRLQELAPEISHAHAKRQRTRTKTEMELSVLNDVAFPTPGAKWWQAMREQAGQVTEVGRASIAFRRNRLTLARYNALIDGTSIWARVRRLCQPWLIAAARIERDACLFEETEMLAEVAARVREITDWSELKAQFAAQDPTFNRDEVDRHQLVSYTIHFSLRMAHADTAMSGAERDNLVGQWKTAVRLCKENGMWQEVACKLPSELAAAAESLVLGLIGKKSHEAG